MLQIDFPGLDGPELQVIRPSSYRMTHTTDKRPSDMAILILTIVWKFQKMGPKISEMTEKRLGI